MNMNRKNRVLFLSIVLLIVLALPVAALANVTKWQARLAARNELHEVVGSSANGTANLRSGSGGIEYHIQIQGLSGPATGLHIHGPADTTQNAPVLIPLCSGNCPPLDANGRLMVEGTITAAMIANAGLTAQQFISYLNDGMLYVNVHTSLNPAGESRGQLYIYNP
jgi:hypothetical protein